MSDAERTPMGLLVALVLAPTLLLPASALNCYLCRSAEDPSCATNPQNQGDCDEYLAFLNAPIVQVNTIKNTTHCVSLVYTNVTENSGRKYTERMCVPIPDMTNPCLEVAKMVKVESCHFCSEDLCNRGGRTDSIQKFYILLLYYVGHLLLT
ncbi:uncharacterized protein LOC126234306 isoform X2 [Schistocerca nitens]|uniref:uncharacterized protein LOC126234306 isoform X2 n=1 Tax=Schistocerca nitens TaxID=7011 RepID=UPI0021185A74|nr:uncharacterized protein LOC126234306 isoform X2 [Schistocerca nitens]